MKLTYEKFATLPMKVRILYVKKLLNELGYNLEESFKDDKQYKKALRKFQINNGYAGNCMIDINTFYSLIKQVKNYYDIWMSLKSR